MKKRTIILTFIILIIVLHCIVPVALFAADLPLSPNPIPSPRTYDAGHDLEQLRGSMCGDYYVEQNFNDLRAMGANLVRWHLMFDYSSKTDYSNPTVYTQWLESELVKAEIVAKKCKSLRMLMIIDLVSQFPGDTSGPTCKGSPIFSRKESADSFVHTWEVIAEHFKDDKTVWAFELLNEPQVPFIPGPLEEKAGQSDDVWNNLFVIATEHIRAIDPDRFVIYDPIMGCHPYSYILLSPLSIDRVIYTVHLYSPFDLTYQGLQTYPLSGATYPGNIWNDGWENWILSRQWTEKKNNWDKKTLRKLLHLCLISRQRIMCQFLLVNSIARDGLQIIPRIGTSGIA